MLARAGAFAWAGPRLVRNPARARRVLFASGYERIDALPVDIVTSFLDPVLGTRARARGFQPWLLSRATELLAIEPGLRRLDVPALVVWGTDDAFFEVRWAHWLAETLPGADGVVELDGARLCSSPTSAPPSSCPTCSTTGAARRERGRRAASAHDCAAAITCV